MAIAGLRAKVFSRGQGHSAVSAAAYRARCVLEDERTGEVHDYTRHRSRCVFEGIYAPKDAPEWARDRARLWNHVEAFEKHHKAELAKEVEIALPHELTLEQQRYVLQDWIKENVTRKGLIADVAIHAPPRDGDQRNVHAHIMIVMRPLDGTEFIRAKPRFDTYSGKRAAKVEDLMAMRASWERIANRHLERHGHAARIDMGRKEGGGPTVHLGKHATAMERRGAQSERGDMQREAANQNGMEARIRALEAEIAALKAERARDAARAAPAPEPAKAAPERDQAAAEKERREAIDRLRDTVPRPEPESEPMPDKPAFRAFPNMAATFQDGLKDQAHREWAERKAAFDRDQQRQASEARERARWDAFWKSAEDMRRNRGKPVEPAPRPTHPGPEPERSDRAERREALAAAEPELAKARPASRAPEWMKRQDGFEALSPELQAAARKNYFIWQRKKPEEARGHTIHDYVQFAQEQEATRRERREAREAARSSESTPHRETPRLRPSPTPEPLRQPTPKQPDPAAQVATPRPVPDQAQAPESAPERHSRYRFETTRPNLSERLKESFRRTFQERPTQEPAPEPPRPSPEEMRRGWADLLREAVKPQERTAAPRPEARPERIEPYFETHLKSGPERNWRAVRGGVDELSHSERARARADYERWAGNRPNPCSFEKFVKGVQESEAKREAERGQRPGGPPIRSSIADQILAKGMQRRAAESQQQRAERDRQSQHTHEHDGGRTRRRHNQAPPEPFGWRWSRPSRPYQP